ncbi:hypothetical protein [Magnetofaba australis]|uniref:Uncharacterized protein n=1 Tax=Magnetofaba australis IT-1 TaxID=1434232 RepID=A0A1Y2K5I3_9PROT|nr:hypothetical protein [Magnetofaba australis]OSM04800.1 hypothetical protein MAIT1_02893 [Magnetofaba australis IT-1]
MRPSAPPPLSRRHGEISGSLPDAANDPATRLKRRLIEAGVDEAFLFDQHLIQAATYQEPVAEHIGPRTRRIGGVLERTPNILLPLLLSILSLILLLQWRARAKRRTTAPAPRNGEPWRLFIGCGAGNEKDLLAEYQQEPGETVFVARDSEPDSFLHLLRPGLGPVVRQMRAYALKIPADAVAFAQTTGIPPGLAMAVFSRLGAMAGLAQACAAQLARAPYASARTITPNQFAWIFSQHGLRPISFREHGWLRKGYHFYPLDEWRVYSQAEAEFVRQVGQSPNVRLIEPIRWTPRLLTRKVLFTSIFDTPSFQRDDYAQTTGAFLNWAQTRGVEVIVRPHPREDRSFWSRNFPHITLDDSDPSFLAAMERLSPLFVVSWFSTTLLESLFLGVIPITLYPQQHMETRDYCFPHLNHVLHWPADKLTLEQALESPQSAQKAHADLFAGVH